MADNASCSYPHWKCGFKFVKWGLAFFIFGLLIGFGVLIHYLMGARYNHSDRFLTNMTLWFGSPLSLSAAYIQLGGLGMVAVGSAKLWISKLCCDKTTVNGTVTQSTHSHLHHGHGALNLAVLGLILLFLTGYVGYFVINSIWPGFYYAPIDAGKNLWLSLQGISLLIYFIGIVSAYCCIAKCCKSWCETSCETKKY